MIVRAPNRSQGRLGCLKPGLGQYSLLTSLIYWLFALVSGEVYMYTPYIIILLDQKQEWTDISTSDKTRFHDTVGEALQKV